MLVHELIRWPFCELRKLNLKWYIHPPYYGFYSRYQMGDSMPTIIFPWQSIISRLVPHENMDHIIWSILYGSILDWQVCIIAKNSFRSLNKSMIDVWRYRKNVFQTLLIEFNQILIQKLFFDANSKVVLSKQDLHRRCVKWC